MISDVLSLFVFGPLGGSLYNATTAYNSTESEVLSGIIPSFSLGGNTSIILAIVAIFIGIIIIGVIF